MRRRLKMSDTGYFCHCDWLLGRGDGSSIASNFDDFQDWLEACFELREGSLQDPTPREACALFRVLINERSHHMTTPHYTSKAFEDLIRGFELSLKNPEEHFRISINHFDKEEYPLAIEYLNKAFRETCNSPEIYGNRVNANPKIRDFEKAEYKERAKRNPESAEAHCLRAFEHYNRGETDKAIEAVNAAIDWDPENPLAYFLRAIFYSCQREYESAISDYSAAIDLDPANPGAYYNRAIAYSDQGNADLAIADLNKVIELDPATPDAYFRRCREYLSKANSKQPQCDWLDPAAF